MELIINVFSGIQISLGILQFYFLHLTILFIYIIALVCSGCYNKIPQTGWLINNRFYIFIVLQAEKFKIKIPVDCVSGEGLLSGSLCVLTW